MKASSAVEYRSSAPGRPSGHCDARRVELGGGVGDAAAAGEHLAGDSVGAGIVFLREVGDAQLGWTGADGAGVRALETGEDSQQRRFSGAVGPDDADTAPGPDGHVDSVEDHPVSACEGHAVTATVNGARERETSSETPAVGRKDGGKPRYTTLRVAGERVDG